MAKSMKLTQQELEELAATAEKLSDWLEIQGHNDTLNKPQRLPGPLTVFASLALASTAVMIMDEVLPDSMCWFGSCSELPD